MITLLTALYPEAEPLIQYFQLKKTNTLKEFQLFVGNDIQLLITNPSSISAAISFTQLICTQSFTSHDLFLNIGICGCENTDYPIGSIFLCNQIIDSTTQMTYYPDILYQHPFSEATLITVPIQKVKKEMFPFYIENKPDLPSSHTISLYDMEASGLYQAGITYLKQHQMLFLKIISDYLTPDMITKEKLSSLLSQALPSLLSFILTLLKRPIPEPKMITEKEAALLHSIAETFCFSVTMTEQLKQLFLYGKTLQLPIYQYYSDSFHLFTEQKSLRKEQTHFTKKEGKQYLEQLKQSITSHVSSHLCGNKSTFSPQNHTASQTLF